MVKKSPVNIDSSGETLPSEPSTRTVMLSLDLKKGTIAIRLPIKGARWKGAYKNMDAAMEAAVNEIGHGFSIRYIKAEDKKDA